MAIGGVTGLSRRGFLPPLFGNLHSRSVQWGVLDKKHKDGFIMSHQWRTSGNELVGKEAFLCGFT